MQAIRQVIDAHLLSNIIPMPQHFYNQKVEVIVSPVVKKEGKPTLSRNQIDELMRGSISETLLGIIPDTGKTLKEYRAERLGRYECID